MKKILSFALLSAFAFAFVACGGAKKSAKLKKNEFISTQCDMVCSKDECNQVCTTISGTLK